MSSSDFADLEGLQIEPSKVKIWDTFHQDLKSFMASSIFEQKLSLKVDLKTAEEAKSALMPLSSIEDNLSKFIYKNLRHMPVFCTDFSEVVFQAKLIHHDTTGLEQIHLTDFVLRKKINGKGVNILPVKLFSCDFIPRDRPEYANLLPEIWKEMVDYDAAVALALKNYKGDVQEEALDKLDKTTLDKIHKRNLKNVVTSIHTCMVVAGNKYGFLSCGTNSWFLCRHQLGDGNEELWISTPFGNGPDAFRCFVYLDHLTEGSGGLLEPTESLRAALEEFTYSPKPPIKTEADEPSGPVDLSENDLKFGWLLSANENHRVYLAKWKEQVVVVKLSPIPEEEGQENPRHQSEVRAYQALRDLQGSFIPKLKFFGTFDSWYSVLAFEYTNGIDAGRCGRKLEQKEKDHIQQAVDEIHREGVLHKGLQPSNVIVHSDPSTMPLLIDFALSELRAEDQTDDNWSKADDVEKLLGSL